MAREDDRHPPGGLLAEHAGQDVDPDGVEAAERLVEHERLGAVDERGRELHALLVAERERLGAVPLAVADAEDLGRALRLGPGVRGLEPVQAREIDELVEHPHLRVQAALLRHVAEAATHLGVHGSAAPADLAGVGLQHAEGDPHRRGLAGAVRTDEAHHLARRRP